MDHRHSGIPGDRRARRRRPVPHVYRAARREVFRARVEQRHARHDAGDGRPPPHAIDDPRLLHRPRARSARVASTGGRRCGAAEGIDPGVRPRRRHAGREGSQPQSQV